MALVSDAGLTRDAPSLPALSTGEDVSRSSLVAALRRGDDCVLDLQERDLAARDDELALGARRWIRHLRKQIAKGEYVCHCAPCRRRRELDATVAAELAS